jgi:hypothetical protein
MSEGLAQFQRAYVRLCADASARARWAQDPDGFAAGYPALDERGRAALEGLDPVAVERYAQGLLSKRAEEFGAHVWRSERAGVGLVGRYRRWLATNPAPPSGPWLPPGLQEALRCLPWVRAELVQEDRADVAELVAFEVWEAASRLDGQVRELEAGGRVDLRLMALGRGEPWEQAREEAARYSFRFTSRGAQWRRL